MDLIDKPNRDLPLPTPWEDRPISRLRWRAHRDVMVRESLPGTRPPEWWHYERRMAEPAQQAAALLAMGDLSSGELNVLMPEWRDWFDRSWEPGFAFNAGDRWLEGAPARAAWYQLHGIPPIIIKQLSAERRRSAKIVRGLKRVPKPAGRS